MKTISIKDVAERVGVSDKTVSRVVNGATNVSRETRERIETAIEELGYVPNQGARLLRGDRSNVIGIVTDTVTTSPNSVEILRGIQDRVGRSDNSVLIANTDNEPAVERRVWRTFRQHRIDGVIYVSMYHRDVELPFRMPQHPMVLANCVASGHPDLPAVVPDDYQGGFDAARFAIEHGHDRIAFLTLNPRILAARLRGQAFEDATRDLQTKANLIVESGYRGAVGQEHLCAFDKSLRLLSLPPAERPTILLCGNDEIAMQAICGALSLGLRIPHDVAIVGFDDFKMISTGLEPQLTTVALPYYDIGVRAADRLLAILDGEDDDVGTERMPCPMVRRASA